MENKTKALDSGPFYHGTRADLQVGDLLTAGSNSNYKPELTMNHIYFTALIDGAAFSFPANDTLYVGGEANIDIDIA